MDLRRIRTAFKENRRWIIKIIWDGLQENKGRI